MSEEEAIAEIEKWGEEIDIEDVSSIGIQDWAREWAE